MHLDGIVNTQTVCYALHPNFCTVKAKVKARQLAAGQNVSAPVRDGPSFDDTTVLFIAISVRVEPSESYKFEGPTFLVIPISKLSHRMYTAESCIVEYSVH